MVYACATAAGPKSGDERCISEEMWPFGTPENANYRESGNGLSEPCGIAANCTDPGSWAETADGYGPHKPPVRQPGAEVISASIQ